MDKMTLNLAYVFCRWSHKSSRAAPMRNWPAIVHVVLLSLSVLCCTCRAQDKLPQHRDPRPPPCQGNTAPQRFVRDPTDCSVFYMCFRHRSWRMSCTGPSTVYSLRLKVCVWRNSLDDDCSPAVRLNGVEGLDFKDGVEIYREKERTSDVKDLGRHGVDGDSSRVKIITGFRFGRPTEEEDNNPYIRPVVEGNDRLKGKARSIKLKLDLNGRKAKKRYSQSDTNERYVNNDNSKVDRFEPKPTKQSNGVVQYAVPDNKTKTKKLVKSKEEIQSEDESRRKWTVRKHSRNPFATYSPVSPLPLTTTGSRPTEWWRLRIRPSMRPLTHTKQQTQSLKEQYPIPSNTTQNPHTFALTKSTEPSTSVPSFEPKNQQDLLLLRNKKVKENVYPTSAQTFGRDQTRSFSTYTGRFAHTTNPTSRQQHPKKINLYHLIPKQNGTWLQKQRSKLMSPFRKLGIIRRNRWEVRTPQPHYDVTNTPQATPRGPERQEKEQSYQTVWQFGVPQVTSEAPTRLEFRFLQPTERLGLGPEYERRVESRGTTHQGTEIKVRPQSRWKNPFLVNRPYIATTPSPVRNTPRPPKTPKGSPRRRTHSKPQRRRGHPPRSQGQWWMRRPRPIHQQQLIRTTSSPIPRWWWGSIFFSAPKSRLATTSTAYPVTTTVASFKEEGRVWQNDVYYPPTPPSVLIATKPPTTTTTSTLATTTTTTTTTTRTTSTTTKAPARKPLTSTRAALYGQMTTAPPLPHRAQMSEHCGILARPMIIGGRPSGGGQWPWQVSLQVVSAVVPWHRCGGVLIHSAWVLTAAHCMEGSFYGDARNWRVVLAEDNLDRESGREIYRRIARIISHPGYIRTSNFPNDVALLQLNEPVDLSTGEVGVACLPDDRTPPSDVTHCWISGWGETRGSGGVESGLNELPMVVVDNADCGPMWRRVGIHVLSDQMCVGHGDTGACYGDSGGPLMCQHEGRFYVTGVMSWLINNCSARGFPNVFTRVTSFLDWIYHHLDFYEWWRYN